MRDTQIILPKATNIRNKNFNLQSLRVAPKSIQNSIGIFNNTNEINFEEGDDNKDAPKVNVTILKSNFENKEINLKD